jgi:hypothetical protein
MKSVWPTFRMKQFPHIVFRPVYEHFGDAKGPGDLYVSFDSEHHMTEDEIRQCSRWCNSAADNFGRPTTAGMWLKRIFPVNKRLIGSTP